MDSTTSVVLALICLIILVLTLVWLSNIRSVRTVVLFYNDNCGHCKVFKPEWEKLKQVMHENPDFVLLDVDVADENAMKSYSITIDGIPTIAIFDSSNKHEFYEGERTADALQKFLIAL